MLFLVLTAESAVVMKAFINSGLYSSEVQTESDV